MATAWSSVFVLLVGAQGMRSGRSRRSHQQNAGKTATMGGVAVHNHHLAHQQSSTLAEQGWVVIFRAATEESRIHEFCQQFDKGCAMSGHSSSGGLPFAEVSAPDEALSGLLEPFAGSIKFVEPDVMVSPIPEIERDVKAPSFVQADNWGLERIGATSSSTTGAGVHIFVVDTGIRSTHQDFGGRAIPTADVTSGSIVECGSDSSCADDTQGHGTHCAGIAGGTNYGVATQASVHSIRVFAGAEAPVSWSYAALDWIASKGDRPAVASMSLGTAGKLAAFQEAVDSAVAAGVTVVVAGGNFNADACGYSPAYVRSAITVGSTNPGDARSEFSNFGSCVNLWAPGTEISSLSHSGDTMTKVLSGTSMSAPFVSGGAALLLQSSPSMTPSQVQSALVNSATKGGIMIGLTDDDDNNLLWVGSGPAPAPAPLTCADGTYGPDSDNDCRCRSGKRCYQGGDYGCTCSSGSRCGVYFVATCYNCRCLR